MSELEYYLKKLVVDLNKQFSGDPEETPDNYDRGLYVGYMEAIQDIQMFLEGGE